MTPPARGRSILTAVAALAVTMLVTAQGCQDYKQFNPQGALRIEIPDSATEVQKLVDPDRVQFLMPNDQWRDYVQGYFPGRDLTSEAITSELHGEVPPLCIQAFRDGHPLSSRSASDEIRWFDTDLRYRRGVSVVPECEPGQAYITWIGQLITDQSG